MSALWQAVTTIPDDVLLGVGSLCEGPTHFGVSRGGMNVQPNVEKRNVPFDNKMADIAELDWDTFSGAVITGTMIQFQTRIRYFEPGSVTTAPGGNITTLVTPKESGAFYAAADYLTNLRYVMPRQAGGFFQVRFPSAICQTYQITGTDREEHTVQATFAARLPIATAASAPGTKPYVFEVLAAFS